MRFSCAVVVVCEDFVRVGSSRNSFYKHVHDASGYTCPSVHQGACWLISFDFTRSTLPLLRILFLFHLYLMALCALQVIEVERQGRFRRAADAFYSDGVSVPPSIGEQARMTWANVQCGSASILIYSKGGTTITRVTAPGYTQEFELCGPETFGSLDEALKRGSSALLDKYGGTKIWLAVHRARTIVATGGTDLDAVADYNYSQAFLGVLCFVATVSSTPRCAGGLVSLLSLPIFYNGRPSCFKIDD